jgi:hypothetical protein
MNVLFNINTEIKELNEIYSTIQPPQLIELENGDTFGFLFFLYVFIIILP